jgi:hypothetical protein
MTPLPAEPKTPIVARIWRVKGGPADHYAVIFVDQRGLPLVALTEWYRWCGERKALKTRDTYASCLLRWHTYLLQQGIAWDAPCGQLQSALVTYHAIALGCQVEPDCSFGQAKITSTGATPLRDSTLGVLRAAVRNFYAILIEEGLYQDANPMTSAILTRLESVRRGHIINAGAPDYAGIRDPRLGHRRTPAFVRQPTAHWRVDWQQTTSDIAAGIHADIRAMVAHPTINARDRAVILLLLYTGARVNEIVRLSVGGYRVGGVAGEAQVRNKGSRGREVKTIFFGQAPSVQRALADYLMQERPVWGRGGQPLHAVADHEPFFLSMCGTPYTEDAFYQHWYHLYEAITHQCSRHFSPHDLRHLMVTECLRLAREQCAGDGEAYVRAKKGLEVLMDWRSPRTVEIYDHSLDPERALGLVVARNHALEEGGRILDSAQPSVADGCPVGENTTATSLIGQPTMTPAPPSAGSTLVARMRQHYGDGSGGSRS